MGSSLIWTLASLLFNVLLCQHTKGVTLSSPSGSVFLGDTVRLFCSDVNPKEVKFYKNNSLLDTEHYTLDQYENRVDLTISSVSKSDEGLYSCGINQQNKSPENHLRVTETTRRVSLTLDPNWPEVFVGETLTFRCEVEGSEDDWIYDWSRNNEELTERTRENTVSYVTESDGGDYICRRWSFYLTTQWSSTTTVNVLNKPVARVSGYTELQTGGSVTLSCSVSPSSSGWKYQWYRNRQFFTHGSSELRVSEGGEYQCRAFRGDPPYFTELSPSFRLTTAAVTLDPNWSVMFVGEKLTLRCEVENGRAAGWTYQWRRKYWNSPITSREYTVSKLRKSDSGVYRCRGEKDLNHKTLWSSTTSVTVQNKPVARVSADTELQTGGSVTLSCSVSPSSSGWKYEWNKSLFTHGSSELRVSEGGEYQCRAFRGDPPYFTELSPSFRLTQTGSSAASLSVDPHWPQMFPGEQLTLSCEVHRAESGGSYEWSKSGQSLHHTQSHITIRNTAPTDSGSYSCRGVLDHTVTQWSRPLTVHVSDSVPRPLLSASVSWLSPGASVSLSCAVTAPSAGWSYHWYRAVPQLQGYRHELLPEASAGTTQDSFSVQGLTNTAAFVCGAARGTPRFSSGHSDPSFVWSADAEASVSLSVSPDRAQHFTGDVITLSCGFNSTDTDWRVQRLYQNKLSTQQCYIYLNTDETKCAFKRHAETFSVFWCESGSGEMSNALNISVYRDIILMSPVRPVTEGQTVSLGCKLKTVTSSVLLFSFYKNGKLVQNGTKAEFNISAVSRSDEGFYKCEAQELKKQWQRSAPKTLTSLESWMSVRIAPKVKDSFPVMWVVGPVCAVVLLILLLLLWRFKIKDLWSMRTVRTNQSSAEDQVSSTDTSPSIGENVTYAQVNRDKKKKTEDVTYSVLELKNIKGRRNCPQEEHVYSEPQPSAGENVTYAQVNYNKKKQTKAKSTPSAAEDTVYSQVQFR